MNHQVYYKKWLLFSPLSLLLVGAGLSMLGDAATVKFSGAAFGQWFWYGTASLVVTNSGIVLMAEAVKNRLLYDLAKKS